MSQALLRTLRQSRLDDSREQLMVELTSVDLFIIDDFALEPMSHDESREVYQLLIERTRHASTIVTSNRDTAEWGPMFDDVLQAQSALDRLTNAAFDLVIEGESTGRGSSPPSATATRHPRRPSRRPHAPADSPAETALAEPSTRGPGDDILRPGREAHPGPMTLSITWSLGGEPPSLERGAEDDAVVVLFRAFRSQAFGPVGPRTPRGWTLTAQAAPVPYFD